MKKIYNIVLTVLTIAMLVFLTFAKLNEGMAWVDLSAYETFISVLSSYGPMVLLCLFAFGSLFGKIMSKIFFVIILILLIVFTITMFAPQVFTSMFGAMGAVIKL